MFLKYSFELASYNFGSYCDMMSERRKCSVREAPQKTSITRQRLSRYVSAATDRFLENKVLLRN
jgi:hypothetical protein